VASPLVRWLTARTADELATVLAHRPDTLEPPSVADLGGLAARLQMNHSVYAALTTLSLPAFEVVEEMAALGGPAVPRERLAAAFGRPTGDPDLAAALRDLADRAIVWTDDAGDLRMAGALWTAGMVAGVGRLDRGAPFHPAPPVVAVLEAAAAAVTDEATTAAIALVETVAAVVGAAPVALRKTGGLGMREARRLAAVTGGDEHAVRVRVELARAAGLLAPAGADSLVPTDAYDAWYADQPAGRFVSLVGQWPTLSTVAGLPPERAGDLVAIGEPAGSAAAALRTALTELLGELPGGHGYADEAAVAAALRWRLPALAPAAAYPRLVAGLLAEGRLVGTVALGALTPFGSALREGEAALRKTADALVPAAVDQAMFQADLTAVVPGLPTGELAALLDAAAVRESTGGAVTWRFTPASVRAALDAGATPEGLRGGLAAIAAGGPLPQVLEVLIADAGRRHGAVTVRSVRCVVHAAEPRVLAEILRTRSLGELGLTRLASTVLGSARPVEETLAALREAGYSPAAEDATGAPLLRRPPRPPAPPPRAGGRHPDDRPAPTREELVGLATRLRAATLARTPSDRPTIRTQSGHSATAVGRSPGSGKAAYPPLLWLVPDPPESDPPPEGATAIVRRHAARLPPSEQELLAGAIVGGTPVWIEYRDSTGERSTRLIEPLELDRSLLTAWCHLRDDERMFSLDRIESVRPS
jgi:hypothetical protein